ncbi:hypothetical protein PybrP1_003869, partial [[Pythium] brassicae (nom. inval.)]
SDGEARPTTRARQRQGWQGRAQTRPVQQQAQGGCRRPLRSERRHLEYHQALLFVSFCCHAHNHERSIYLWRKEHHILAARCSSASGDEKRYNRALFVATSLPRAEEADIVSWINMLRADGVPASNTTLREQAKTDAAAAGVEPFEASWSWRKGFRARHKPSIRARTRHRQIASANAADRARAFGKEVEAMLEKLNVTAVHNADQTGELACCCAVCKVKANCGAQLTIINERGARTSWAPCAGYKKRLVKAILLGHRRESVSPNPSHEKPGIDIRGGRSWQDQQAWVWPAGITGRKISWHSCSNMDRTRRRLSFASRTERQSYAGSARAGRAERVSLLTASAQTMSEDLMAALNRALEIEGEVTSDMDMSNSEDS